MIEKRVGYVDIVTNGTLLPEKDIISKSKEGNIGVVISDYGDISSKSSKLEELLKDSGVRCQRAKIEEWSYIGQFIKKEEDISVTNEKLLKCNNRTMGCKFIRNGRFYYCPFICNAESIG